MAAIKLKKKARPNNTNTNEQPKTKKIRISKSNSETGTKPKLKINLKKKTTNESERSGSSGVKIKLNLKKKDGENGNVEPKVHKTPRIRLKPIRVPGESYDSEDSELEDDPLIEEGIILRVLPDIQAEFVKNSIDSGDYSGVSIKWKGQNHAIVFINNVKYGAILVNLPTIIETHKSVDRKNLLKTFDISQMLLCIKIIDQEEEVFNLMSNDTEDLVSKFFEDYQGEIDDNKLKNFKGYNGGPLTDAETKYLKQIALKSYDYKHGITPPLYNVRNRRFRRKMNPTEFSYVESVVETLLKQDEEAEEITYELGLESEIPKKSTPAPTPGDLSFPIASKNDENTPASKFTMDMEEDELDLEEAFQSDEEENENEAKDNETSDNIQEGIDMNGKLEETGDDVEQYNGEDEDEDDEEDDEDEGDDNVTTEKDVNEVDKDRQVNELLKDELNELESILQHTKQKLKSATNPLLKSRFIDSIKKLEKEVELKRKQFMISEGVLNQSNTLENNKEMEDEEEEDLDEEEDDIDDEEEDQQPTEQPQDNEATENNDNEEQLINDVASLSEDIPVDGNNEVLDQNDLDMMMLFGAEGDD